MKRRDAIARESIAALLALGAALFIAISDVIHQQTAHAVTDQAVGHVELFTRLLAVRRWLVGSLVAAVGFGLQAAALGLGSVLLVAADAVIIIVGHPTAGQARAWLHTWAWVAAVPRRVLLRG